MNERLASWNAAEQAAAVGDILPCNGSQTWATQLALHRPFADEGELFRAADLAWASLSLHDQQQAYDSHPRLGDRHAPAASDRSLAWSAGEQSSLERGSPAQEAEVIRLALAEANRAYEARFGHIFLVCATGKTATEILSILRQRLGNDDNAEAREIAEQQRRITQLRLRKWLCLPPARCEDV